MNPLSTAPRDGTRILLKYTVLHYKTIYTHISRHKVQGHGEWTPDGEKWEEFYWDAEYVSNPLHGDPVRGIWRPWCGNPETKSTHMVSEEHALGWLPRPED